MTFRLTRRIALAGFVGACASGAVSRDEQHRQDEAPVNEFDSEPREIAPGVFEIYTQLTENIRVRRLVMGRGRPALLLHGFLADAQRNWVDTGIAARIAASGRQVIMPDFIAHGGSDPLPPVDPPQEDVLSLQSEGLRAQLGLTDFDLVGYSMGARTAVRLMAQGWRPARCVLGGMGDFGITDFAVRQRQFETWLANVGNAADPQSRAVETLLAGKRVEDMLRILRTQVETPAETLRAIETPILVVSGAQDNDNGSAEGLAALFPNARAQRVPGTHLSAVRQPELAQAIVDFLSA